MQTAVLQIGSRAKLRPGALSSKRVSAAPRVSRLHAVGDVSTLPELNGLWSWCHENGVPTVGDLRCKLSLFESASGERGFYAVTDIAQGEILLSIPLKLAILVHRDDAESNALVYQGAPWSVRLACKLLRERALGEESLWFPYIQSLPSEIPCVLLSFSYEDIEALEYGDVRAALDQYVWMVSDAWQRLSPEAHGNSTRDAFDWAMSVVHSRTFGTSGKGGPTDVHMLAPLADMFNHGGDRCKGLFKEATEKLDAVEWSILPPEKSSLNQWEMQFVASVGVSANEQVFMSYGERNNDDFLLYYGYIPPLNPKDDYVLFASLEEAVDWYCRIYLPNESADVVQGLKEEALEAGLREEEIVPGGPDDEVAAGGRSQRAKIRLMSGGFLDGRALAAFENLGRITDIPTKAVVAQRCWELLSEKSPLLTDLQLLAEHHPDAEHNFPFLYRFYSAALEKYREAGGKLPGLSGSSEPSLQSLSFSQTLLKTYMVYKKTILWDVLLGLYR